MEQDELYVPPKPTGWVPPPRMVPRNQPPAYNTGQPQYPLYPATGPPPPAQVIHTQNPTAYHDSSYPPKQGQHTVVIVDGYTQQQRQHQDKKQCCMMTICALCLCCLLD